MALTVSLDASMRYIDWVIALVTFPGYMGMSEDV
jgi:hypothetical protein